VKPTETWNITDLIDFEYLLEVEAGTPDDPTFDRDCESFQKDELPALQAANMTSRRAVFHAWLQMRRDPDRQPPNRKLPGGPLQSAWQLVVILSIVAGLMTGGSLTSTLLYYRGKEPVNVPWFLACTLGIQILSLIAVMALGIVRKTTRMLDSFRPLQALVTGLLWTAGVGLRKLPTDLRQRIQIVLQRLSTRREIYGSVATWPVVAVTQLFGVCFNLGILAVFLSHIAFKDIDFGWQSTFQQSDQSAFQIVSTVAKPWSWLAPHPHPTLSEVESSHFSFNHHQSNKSWWPFITYCILFYGLLVRIGLLGLIRVRWHQALMQLGFDHDRCNWLYRKLTGPIVKAQGPAESLVIPDVQPSKPERLESGVSVAIVAEETNVPQEQLASYIRSSYGWSLASTHFAQVDFPGGSSDLFSSLAGKNEHLAGVVVVVPARRAPIRAIAVFLQKLSAAVGTRTEVILLLLGPDNGAAQVDTEMYKYWENFRAINGLKVSLEKWSLA